MSKETNLTSLFGRVKEEHRSMAIRRPPVMWFHLARHQPHYRRHHRVPQGNLSA